MEVDDFGEGVGVLHRILLLGVAWVSIGLSEMGSGLVLGRVTPMWWRDTARDLLSGTIMACCVCVCVRAYQT